MNDIKLLVSENIRKYGMIIALIGIAILFQVLTNGILLTPLNITNIIMQNSYIIILAIGMMLVIITGEIDLSVGSVAAFIGAVAGILIVTYNLPVVVGILLSLLLGAVIGAWQGFWVAYVNIPSFIVTLAGMLIFRGLTLVVLGGKTIAPFPDSFRSMSSSFIPDVFWGEEFKIFTVIIGIVISIVFVINEVRLRRTNIKYNFSFLPLPLFLGKLVLFLVLIN